MRSVWLILGVVLAAVLSSCSGYRSQNLKITRLSGRTWIHESYLPTETWGRVGCNGLVYISAGEAVVLDTPTDSAATAELLAWLQNRKAKVVAVVPNHFHNDCMATLAQFHAAGISSYALDSTVAWALRTGYKGAVPNKVFHETLNLRVGANTIVNWYPGPAHTRDNIVTYLPHERVLFGGCMVKALGAGRGFTGDADTTQWAATIKKVKENYTDVRYVVPGHGKPGTKELLDYTQKMWERKP